jgi:hypothetical protein
MVLMGIADLTVESNVAPHVGVSGTVGGGVLVFDPAIKMWLAGASANYYLTRSFSGWHLGALARYAGVTASDAMSSVNLFGSGLSVAGYGGYKWMRPSGFTAFVDVGFGLGRVMISDGSGGFAMNEAGLALNFGVGYSF